MGYHIIVAGNIGVGKTTVARAFERQMEFKFFEESVSNNPYLEPFYEDMKKYSYDLQMFFLMTRTVDHTRAMFAKKSCVQDRCVYEDANIFAKNLHETGLMSAKEYNIYLNFYNDRISRLKQPDLLVYLHAEVSTLRERIKMRGRVWEESLTQEDNQYLDQLQNLYTKWHDGYQGNKIFIDTKKIDAINNESELIAKIKEQLPK